MDIPKWILLNKTIHEFWKSENIWKNIFFTGLPNKYENDLNYWFKHSFKFDTLIDKIKHENFYHTVSFNKIENINIFDVKGVGFENLKKKYFKSFDIANELIQLSTDKIDHICRNCSNIYTNEENTQFYKYPEISFYFHEGKYVIMVDVFDLSLGGCIFDLPSKCPCIHIDKKCIIHYINSDWEPRWSNVSEVDFINILHTVF